MTVNGDSSERPSPAKVRGVFCEGASSYVGSGSVLRVKLGVIYVLESVLRVHGIRVST